MKTELFMIDSISIQPFPYFYVDYLAVDRQKIAVWELANLPYSLDRKPLTVRQEHMSLIEDMLVNRRTKVFDNPLKTLVTELVSSFIDKMSFKIEFEAKNRIIIHYICDDTISNEIYNTTIKAN